MFSTVSNWPRYVGHLITSPFASWTSWAWLPPVAVEIMHVYFAKRFLFSKELYMLQCVNAVYYPHLPDMIVRIYKAIIKQKLTNHVRSSRRLYHPFILIFSSFVMILNI